MHHRKPQHKSGFNTAFDHTDPATFDTCSTVYSLDPCTDSCRQFARVWILVSGIAWKVLLVCGRVQGLLTSLPYPTTGALRWTLRAALNALGKSSHSHSSVKRLLCNWRMPSFFRGQRGQHQRFGFATSIASLCCTWLVQVPMQAKAQRPETWPFSLGVLPVFGKSRLAGVCLYWVSCPGTAWDNFRELWCPNCCQFHLGPAGCSGKRASHVRIGMQGGLIFQP